MTRLGERSDDRHLDRSQRLEESLKSVDYDVWVCGACSVTLVVQYNAWFSSHSACRHCKRRTAKSTTKTLRAATTSSTGLAEVTTTCRNCNAHDVEQRVLPVVTQSSSGGGGGSSGGGGLSGGSFGGGSASGGGAGRSY